MRERMTTLPRIALVYDWLDTWRGGENVLAEIVRIYPDADLFALVDFLPEALRPRLSGKRARTTFLQRIPGARRHFRQLLPLFPRAIESLDLSAYDLVISISHAVAKGARTTPRATPHLLLQHADALCVGPARPVSRGAKVSRQACAVRSSIAFSTGCATGTGAPARASRISSPTRSSCAIASPAATTATSTVIYPPVDTDFFTPAVAAERRTRDYYFAASRWVPYKRMDVIAQAFRDLPERRLIVAGDGPEAARVRACRRAQRRVRRRGFARADARSAARRARLRVRRRGGLRHPAASKRRRAGRRSSPTAAAARARPCAIAARAVRPDSSSPRKRRQRLPTRCAASSRRRRRSIRATAASRRCNSRPSVSTCQLHGVRRSRHGTSSLHGGR